MNFQQTLPSGTLLDGIYRIERPLGSGGFSNTYLANDQQLNRQVAIKEYFPTDFAIRNGTYVEPSAEKRKRAFDSGLERFTREAKTLRTVTHPNIVRVYRSFDTNNTSYITLEYIDGDDLEDWLTALGRRPTQEELDRFVVPLLDALERVHSVGVLHRDISPKNIRIRKRDGEPVLLDFGAAKSMDGERPTITAFVLHNYSPVESYSTTGLNQGPRTDIYSLAATFYRALAEKPPLGATERMLHDELVSASKLPLKGGGYRSSFLKGLDWGLAVYPDRRPRSVAEWRPRLLEGSGRATGKSFMPATPVVRASSIAPSSRLAPSSPVAIVRPTIRLPLNDLQSVRDAEEPRESKDPRSTLPKGGVLGGAYEILDILGRGGFSLTYKALDRAANRQVALKEFYPRKGVGRANDYRLVPANNEEFARDLSHFISESDAQAEFTHRNIARFDQCFYTLGTAYIAMEYVDGIDLQTWIATKRAAILQSEIDYLLVQLLDALECIHERGILHLDIKPSNILLRSNDGSAVIIDFGSSQYRDGRASAAATATAVVTPHYSPLELYFSNRERRGPWSDIYSLGATLFHAICGEPPPDASSLSLAIEADRSLARRPSLVGNFRSGFLSSVDWALRMDATERPQSIAEWRQRLFLATEHFGLGLQAEPVRAAIQADVREAVREKPARQARSDDRFAASDRSARPKRASTRFTVMINSGPSDESQAPWIEQNDDPSILIRKTSSTDVFLSYAREDRERVAQLVQGLEAQGWHVFWDYTILPGDRWEDIIESAIENAKCVVVVWSGQSIESDWVREEAEIGKKRKILVPVRIEPVNIPIGFGRIHSADLAGWDGDLEHVNYQLFLMGVKKYIRDSARPT